MISIQPIRQLPGGKSRYAQTAPHKEETSEGFAALLQQCAAVGSLRKVGGEAAPQAHFPCAGESEVERLRRQILRTNREAFSLLLSRRYPPES